MHPSSCYTYIILVVNIDSVLECLVQREMQNPMLQCNAEIEATALLKITYKASKDLNQ